MLSGNPTDSISLINAHAEKDRFSAIQMHEQQQLHHLRYSPLSDQLNQRPVSQLSQLSFIRQQESEHLSQRHYKASPPGIMDHNTSGAIHDHSDLQDMQHSLGSHLISVLGQDNMFPTPLTQTALHNTSACNIPDSFLPEHTSRYDTTNSIESNALASPSLYGISPRTASPSRQMSGFPRSSGLSGSISASSASFGRKQESLSSNSLSINTDMPLLFSASPISSPFAPGAVGSPIGGMSSNSALRYRQQHFGLPSQSEKTFNLNSPMDLASSLPGPSSGLRSGSKYSADSRSGLYPADIVYLQQHFEKQHHLQSSLDNALFQPHGLQHMNHTQPQSDLSSSAPLNHSSSNFNGLSSAARQLFPASTLSPLTSTVASQGSVRPTQRKRSMTIDSFHPGNTTDPIGIPYQMNLRSNSDDAQTHSSVGPTTSGSGSSAPKVKNPTLYKTELCRAWEETGSCRYGTKCQFAHSSSELRQLDRHPKYKTEMCKTFWERGSCLYGKRCCFIHLERTAADGAVPTAAALEAAGITVHAGIATAAMGKKGHAARNPFGDTNSINITQNGSRSVTPRTRSSSEGVRMASQHTGGNHTVNSSIDSSTYFSSSNNNSRTSDMEYRAAVFAPTTSGHQLRQMTSAEKLQEFCLATPSDCTSAGISESDTTNSVEDINDRFETMHFSTSATDTTSTTLSSTAGKLPLHASPTKMALSRRGFVFSPVSINTDTNVTAMAMLSTPAASGHQEASEAVCPPFELMSPPISPN
ncbi:hypothetical protein QVD99_007754 [Batrachochytrium dendrobatidis]|nr:hypothetical protein O5D80_001409 [Batrachochytrium dendrobatidis]KAK5665402.1 hypothetical protein QVD99_007754 [Batrachochytrium dendrobatidis]